MKKIMLEWNGLDSIFIQPKSLDELKRLVTAFTQGYGEGNTVIGYVYEHVENIPEEELGIYAFENNTYKSENLLCVENHNLRFYFDEDKQKYIDEVKDEFNSLNEMLESYTLKDFNGEIEQLWSNYEI